MWCQPVGMWVEFGKITIEISIARTESASNLRAVMFWGEITRYYLNYHMNFCEDYTTNKTNCTAHDTFFFYVNV